MITGNTGQHPKFDKAKLNNSMFMLKRNEISDARLKFVDLCVKAIKRNPKKYFKAHKKFIDDYYKDLNAIYRIVSKTKCL
ncbi:MAG: hypothetical protein PHC66_01600 [Candidatus Nanoarchaeia archaeon]|nr:hypothetical protein [Candidatus Nanoarchaeia archaeon]MDD5239146.1 hypothetical protein [Candidatus Nanoarchaeia archaeon]